MPKSPAIPADPAAAAATPLARLIGRRIRAFRAERGWSRRDLAAWTGLSLARLTTYENGAHEPPLRTLKRLARVFAVHVDALVEETAHEPVPLENVRLLRELRQAGAPGERGREGAAAVLEILVGLERFILARQGRRLDLRSEGEPWTIRARKPLRGPGRTSRRPPTRRS